MISRGFFIAMTMALAASVSSADITIDWVPVDNQGLIPGFQTFDMVIDLDGTWCCSAMLFELSQGVFYQDPAGNDKTPHPLLVTSVPTVEFDTYVSEGDLLDLIVIGGAGDVGGPRDLIFDETTLNVSWAPPGGQRSSGRFRIARVSLSNDAQGDYQMATIGTEIPFTLFTGTVADIVPEPGSLTLLSSGVLVLLRSNRSIFSRS